MENISKWTFQWKIHFNPNPEKTDKKKIFSRKYNNCSHPPVTLNNSAINKYPHHKHLGIVLDSKLVLKFHVGQKILKAVTN